MGWRVVGPPQRPIAGPFLSIHKTGNLVISATAAERMQVAANDPFVLLLDAVGQRLGLRRARPDELEVAVRAHLSKKRGAKRPSYVLQTAGRLKTEGLKLPFAAGRYDLRHEDTPEGRVWFVQHPASALPQEVPEAVRRRLQSAGGAREREAAA